MALSARSNGLCCRAVSHQRRTFASAPRPSSVARRLRSAIIPHAAVRKVDGEELDAAISSRKTPLIVDFYANWCGPCLLLATELEKVAEEMGDAVQVLKVDVDENQQLASALKIEGLPTVVFISTDPTKPALRTEGLMGADQIKQVISEL